MAQRNSGYDRVDGDAYWTPQWVFDELFAVEQFTDPSDCAPREPEPGYDFLQVTDWDGDIVTNPRFKLAEEFIRHGLKLTGQKLAVLLPHAYDTAKGRIDLFRHRHFKCKYTLTQRIRWENIEQMKAGPSSNHAWFVWDLDYVGMPTMGWL